MSFFEKLFGSFSDKELKRINPIKDKVLALEPEMAKLTDEQLQAKTAEFKERLAKGETLDDILPEAFAVCREADWRVLGMKPYPVQIIGGIVLHRACIAEMQTGEGKTLVATMPTYLNALTGEATTIQLQLDHNGPFGMSLKLSVDLDKKHDGLYANLYFYNPKSGELEFQSAGLISGGKASWVFDHASDYAIVIDKESHEPMTFTDVPDTAYYAEAVNWAVAKKITEGVGEDKDILALYQDETEAVVQVFFVRDGKLIGREHYYMTHVPENNKPAILQDFVKQFYAGTPFIPRELMLQYEIEDAELIEKWLSERKGSRVYLKVPKIGSKEKLVELAAQNAKLVLSQDREKLKREEGRTIGAVKEISDLLQLPLTGTARMEAYDISNINGFENVGSMVVYEKGKPKRSDYRKFKIKSVSGPDDYACMREVLTRRFRHGMEESKELEEQEMDQEYGSFTKFPDLILMDGGRGQVNIALSVLEELEIDIPVCGMVKDDNHRTRGLYYHNIELPIDTHSEGFKLITRIQDEAHRFAIEYHRSLRSKTQVKSVLDDIPGVGPARRKALMRHFKSLEEIRQASVEELMEIPEMNERTAEEIVTFFASQTGQPVVH